MVHGNQTTLFKKIGCYGEAPLKPHIFTIQSSNSNAKFLTITNRQEKYFHNNITDMCNPNM